MSKRSIRARAPVATSPDVRRVMQANWGNELSPERTLRSELHRIGLRFRKNRRPLAGLRCTADIVFPRHRLCVFVDGCFWHGCPLHFSCPKSHSGWWREKIEATKRRDKQHTAALRRGGWRVVRLWEHEVRINPARSAKVISEMLNLVHD